MPPGILPLDASRHDAANNICCCAGEYAAQSEKLTALRPALTAYAISQDSGALWVYQGHSVALE
jgi:hypothetical protein